jgi:hypothetical protein
MAHQNWYRVGTISVTAGSTAVTGTLTGWTDQVSSGDHLTIDGTRWAEVASVTSNTALTLVTPWSGPTAAGSAYAIARVSPLWTLASSLATRVADLLSRLVTIFTTSGVPSSAIGANGAVAVDTAAKIVYFRGLGGWDAGTALVGTQGPAGTDGVGVPAGGAIRQVLRKSSATNYATEWATARDVLTATRTYYVSPTGSDANSGLSAAQPFLTIGKAYSTIADTLDLGGQTVTIQLDDGTYAAGLAVQKPWVGGGSVVLQGNTTTPASVIINPGVFGAYGVYVNTPLPGLLSVTGVKFVCAATAIHHESTGLIRFGKVDFGACGSYHIATAAPGAKIEANDAYTISGAAASHWLANGQGLIVVAGRTVTISGTPAFAAAFAYATRLSQIQGYSNTFTGTATGVRYLVDGNSLIFTNGGGTTAYPGNSAGSASTGGQYV